MESIIYGLFIVLALWGLYVGVEVYLDGRAANKQLKRLKEEKKADEWYSNFTQEGKQILGSLYNFSGEKTILEIYQAAKKDELKSGI